MTWIGARGLFAIVYTTSVASVYFALGVVAGRALGLTPLVFLVGGLFFGLAGMTYAEGAAGHPEAGGSTVFARYAFNELVSFVTGWAVILDYVIVLAATALAATGYLGTLWSPAGSGLLRFALAAGIVGFVVVTNVRGLSPFRLSRRVVIAFGDIAVQLLVVVLGLALVFHPGALADSVDLGTTPSWSDLVFALTLVTVAFTGLEAAASLSAEVRIERRDLRRLMGGGVAVIVLVYLGISLVAISALPVEHGRTALGGRWEDAPLVGVVRQFHPHWLAEAMSWIVAVSGTVALVAAANSAMLGVSRLAYSLATNRQIPSALGRLSQRFGTPWVLIALSGVFAVALLIPTDLEFLVGIYAFGAMLAFTIAHVSIIRLRYREPDRPRAFRVPLGVRIGGGEVPLPAAFGAVLSAAAWVSVLILHAPARYVGVTWMAFGLVLYVAYRRGGGKPLLGRVTIPAQALRYEAPEREFGSILVPIFGEPLDDDIVQTAGRLAGRTRAESDEEGDATIEAIWVFEVPLSLPLDARLPDAQVRRARAALARAKSVGEEYEGVQVQTAMTRARRAGQGIVHEAKRRGVEAIVLAAEEPSRIRGGSLLGGSGGPLDNSVGEVTKHVIRKAECRVILTAAPVEVVAAATAETTAEPASGSSAEPSPKAPGTGDPAR